MGFRSTVYFSWMPESFYGTGGKAVVFNRWARYDDQLLQLQENSNEHMVIS